MVGMIRLVRNLVAGDQDAIQVVQPMTNTMETVLDNFAPPKNRLRLSGALMVNAGTTVFNRFYYRNFESNWIMISRENDQTQQQVDVCVV